MATINVRTDDQTRADLEAVARGQGITVSDLLRMSIDHALGRDAGDHRSASIGAPASLTLLQRRSLALQHSILALLNPDEADYHQQRITVLENGYVIDYDEEFYAYSPELSRAESRWVMDMLEMFSVCRRSIAKFGDDELATVGNHPNLVLRFRGFDGNDTHESRLGSYVRYLMDNGRWTDLTNDYQEADGGNSHMPMLPTYRGMVEVFKPIWQRRLHDSSLGLGDDGYKLTLDELKQVYDGSFR